MTRSSLYQSIAALVALAGAAAFSLPAQAEYEEADTWESLAKQSGGASKASSLAIMNGSDPATAPKPGARIRIVVGG